MTAPSPTSQQSAGHTAWLLTLCLAQVFIMLVFMNYSAILPQLKAEWGMTNARAGTIFSGYQLGYILSGVLLSTLTDRLNNIVSAVKTALEHTPPELGADIAERGMRRISESVYNILNDCDAVHISLDIDCLDPSVAPGTGIPEFGGLTSRDVLTLIKSTQDLPLVGLAGPSTGSVPIGSTRCGLNSPLPSIDGSGLKLSRLTLGWPVAAAWKAGSRRRSPASRPTFPPSKCSASPPITVATSARRLNQNCIAISCPWGVTGKSQF